jgi:hypothetical protein
MRYLLIALSLLLGPAVAVGSNVSVAIGFPGVSIGINMPTYPHLVPVPGYPVYYDPRASANYFFYDGLYWAFYDDNWYASSWYNGPWQMIGPQYVPVYILRVPVRYYRQPPAYFRGWSPNAPPHWGEHWGRDWQVRRDGWDQWDRRSAPAPAPRPDYQAQYSRHDYPSAPEQQYALRSGNYSYRPHDPVSRQYYQQQSEYGHSQGPAQHEPPGQQKKSEAHGNGKGHKRDDDDDGPG